MQIVALDLSLTATGVAHRPKTKIETFTIKPTTEGMERIADILRALYPITSKADFVVLEGYSMASKFRAHQLGELGGNVRLSLYEAGIPYADVSPGSLKLYATGRGDASKGAMLVEAVKKLAYEGHDDNEADALWLYQIGLAHCYPARAIPRPERNRKALEAITWPPGLTEDERASVFAAAIS